MVTGKYSPKGWSIQLLSSFFPAFKGLLALQSHPFGEYLWSRIGR